MSVFLSYAEEDADLVHRVFQIFERMELEPYAYKLFEESGLVLEEVIIQRINACKVFIPFLTFVGTSSSWVNQEIGIARALNRFTIPVVEEGVDLSKVGLVQFRIYIPFSRHDPDYTIYLLIRRMQSILNPTAILLECKCGNKIRGKIPSPGEIDNAVTKGLILLWDCSDCGSRIELFPKTLEQLPQQ